MKVHVMILFRSIIFAVLATITWIEGARALDPLAIDILTFRLGMSPQEVERGLIRQGIQPVDWVRRHVACPNRPDAACLSSLTVPTQDGTLEIGFSLAARVERIDYTLRATGPGEPAMIRASVLNRFGPPSGKHDLTWCLEATASGDCPAGQPVLRFRSGPGLVSFLSLTAAVVP